MCLKTAQLYGGSPDDRLERYEARSVLAHTEKLTMPIILAMGEADPLIPVAETRKIAEAFKGNPHFRYVEIPGGGHDLSLDIDLQTLQVQGPA